MALAAWEQPAVQPQLDAGAVHVWRASLANVPARLGRLLSADERERAERFPRPTDGELWASGRAVLRALLGCYLQADPSQIVIGRGADGKPELAGGRLETDAAGTHVANVEFNMSHSRGLALLAFSATGALGVDVEVSRAQRDAVALAARAFGSEEADRLRGLPQQEQQRQFLHAWVRHEARVKCAGTGIRGSAESTAADTAWITDLDVGPAAYGALATEAPPSEVRCFVYGSG